MTRLVLMGGGASFGSERATPCPPPVAGDLLEALRSAFPETWGRIPERYLPTFAKDFELGLGRVWQEQDYEGAPLLRAMAEYFARFSPGRHSTYERFLTGVERAGLLEDTIF